MICGSNYNNSNTHTKGKIKVFTNLEYIAIYLSFEVCREINLVSSTMLYPSATCVTMDTSNMSQSNIKYVVIEIVTVIKCNWLGLMLNVFPRHIIKVNPQFSFINPTYI